LSEQTVKTLSGEQNLEAALLDAIGQGARSDEMASGPFKLLPLDLPRLSAGSGLQSTDYMPSHEETCLQ